MGYWAVALYFPLISPSWVYRWEASRTKRISKDPLGVLTPVKLSRESEYGLKALSVLAAQTEGKVMLLKEIAEAGHLPSGFLAKVFQKLTGHNIVRSHRGAIRGYSLARPANQTNLREILEAIEGPEVFERCLFWEHRCGHGNPCYLHREWSQIKPQFLTRIERMTLADLASGEAL